MVMSPNKSDEVRQLNEDKRGTHNKGHGGRGGIDGDRHGGRNVGRGAGCGVTRNGGDMPGRLRLSISIHSLCDPIHFSRFLVLHFFFPKLHGLVLILVLVGRVDLNPFKTTYTRF